MKISIFGLGYVGCVTAACLADQGNTIIGVDVVESKVRDINNGRWPVYEPGMDDLDVFKRVSATTDLRAAVLKTDVSLVCVGTPSLPDGSVDLTYLKKTISGIARVLKSKKKSHILFIRSTVPPGTNEKILWKLLPANQRKRTAFYPEFLREGTALRDFADPSLNVIGAGSDFPAQIVKKMMPRIKAPLDVVSVSTAESIKYANNAFHALKIAFTNEFARFCKSYGSDADRVMELFCKDTKLNLSPYYMRPGFAFGGSCLPKEVRALISLSKAKQNDVTLLEGVIRSNDEMINALVHLIFSLHPASVGYVGVTFKPNTDDTRESPIMRVIELVRGRGRSYSKKIAQIAFDNPKALDRLRASSDMSLVIADSLAELAKASDVIVLGPCRIDAKSETLLRRSGKHVIDLKWFRVGKTLTSYNRYHSLV